LPGAAREPADARRRPLRRGERERRHAAGHLAARAQEREPRCAPNVGRSSSPRGRARQLRDPLRAVLRSDRDRSAAGAAGRPQPLPGVARRDRRARGNGLPRPTVAGAPGRLARAPPSAGRRRAACRGDSRRAVRLPHLRRHPAQRLRPLRMDLRRPRPCRGSPCAEAGAVIALAAFVLSCALTAWVYAGYPIALALLGHVRARPRRREPRELPASVIVAAHDEVDVIAGKVANVLASDYPAALVELIVASDGSDDGTVEAARRA